MCERARKAISARDGAQLREVNEALNRTLEHVQGRGLEDAQLSCVVGARHPRNPPHPDEPPDEAPLSGKQRKTGSERLQERAQALIERGLSRYRRGEVEAAIIDWRHALALDPHADRAREYIEHAQAHEDIDGGQAHEDTSGAVPGETSDAEVPAGKERAVPTDVALDDIADLLDQEDRRATAAAAVASGLLPRVMRKTFEGPPMPVERLARHFADQSDDASTEKFSLEDAADTGPHRTQPRDTQPISLDPGMDASETLPPMEALIEEMPVEDTEPIGRPPPGLVQDEPHVSLAPTLEISRAEAEELSQSMPGKAHIRTLARTQLDALETYELHVSQLQGQLGGERPKSALPPVVIEDVEEGEEDEPPPSRPSPAGDSTAGRAQSTVPRPRTQTAQLYGAGPQVPSRPPAGLASTVSRVSVEVPAPAAGTASTPRQVPAVIAKPSAAGATPTGPARTPTQPPQAARAPTSPALAPAQPARAPTSPARAPTSPALAPTQPARAPTSPARAPTSPALAPTQPARAPTSPALAPTQPARAPTSPALAPTQPARAPTSPARASTSPALAPTQPARAPTSPARVPASSSRAPSAPVQPPSAPTDPVARMLIERLDEEKPAGGEEAARDRVLWLIEYAQAEYVGGDYQTAITAVDLALDQSPDSVLVQTIIQRYVDSLIEIYASYEGDPSAVPSLAMSPSEYGQRALDNRAAYLLSRVDGMLTIDDLMTVSGMPPLEAHRHLCNLLRQGILTLR